MCTVKTRFILNLKHDIALLVIFFVRYLVYLYDLGVENEKIIILSEISMQRDWNNEHEIPTIGKLSSQMDKL